MLSIMKIKYNLIIAICLIFLTSGVCCANNSAAEEQLSKIENSIWGFSYDKDTNAQRLSRIENNVLGSTNSSLSVDERIKRLNAALGFEPLEDSKKQAYELDSREAHDISYPQIDALEEQIFQSTYKHENIYKRLERLEKKIFGSIQEGNLASRTDKLKAYIKKDVVAQNPNYYNQKPYQPTQDIESYMASQSKYDASDIHIQLAGLESAVFSKTYSQDPVGLRLNRLERKIFQRDFSSDDEFLRLQRLQAAANAQTTAKFYESNKMQKYTSTGLQIGSLILMILALIL